MGLLSPSCRAYRTGRHTGDQVFLPSLLPGIQDPQHSVNFLLAANKISLSTTRAPLPCSLRTCPPHSASHCSSTGLQKQRPRHTALSLRPELIGYLCPSISNRALREELGMCVWQCLGEVNSAPVSYIRQTIPCCLKAKPLSQMLPSMVTQQPPVLRASGTRPDE